MTARERGTSAAARKPPSRATGEAAGIADPGRGGLWAALVYALCTMVLALSLIHI